MYLILSIVAILAVLTDVQNVRLQNLIRQKYGALQRLRQNNVARTASSASTASTASTADLRMWTPTMIPHIPPGINDYIEDTSCLTDTGVRGECVRHYLCSNSSVIITDGVGLIDIRFRDGPCLSYLDACCMHAEPEREPNFPTTEDPYTTHAPVEEFHPHPPPHRPGCGWRNPEGVGFKIIGDTNGESKFGEFPWMVAILKTVPDDGARLKNTYHRQGEPHTLGSDIKQTAARSLLMHGHHDKLQVYVSGGSLIHPSVVLTAAHYIIRYHCPKPFPEDVRWRMLDQKCDAELRVRAGEWDTQTTKEIYPHQERDIHRVVIHPEFNKANLFYDVALLFLSDPVDLTAHINVVCLPPPKVVAGGGTRCFASGWGRDKFEKEGRYQVILKKVDVPVVDTRSCQNSLRQTRLGRFFELHHTFMCAGGELGKDTCRGDGGSPLVCPTEEEDLYQLREERYTQYGIVAWGIGCGEDGIPGVYVDVSSFREWIDGNVASAGFDTSAYTYVPTTL